MGELDDPVVVAFPLRGEWSVQRTPAYRIPSHGTDLLGQRYAYDLVHADHRSGFHLHPAGTLCFSSSGGWVPGGGGVIGARRLADQPMPLAPTPTAGPTEGPGTTRAVPRTRSRWHRQRRDRPGPRMPGHIPSSSLSKAQGRVWLIAACVLGQRADEPGRRWRPGDPVLGAQAAAGDLRWRRRQPPARPGDRPGHHAGGAASPQCPVARSRTSTVSARVTAFTQPHSQTARGSNSTTTVKLAASPLPLAQREQFITPVAQHCEPISPQRAGTPSTLDNGEIVVVPGSFLRPID
jgi:hypothetical protein